MAFPSKGTLISEWEELAVSKYIRDFHDQQLELMGGLKMRRITNAADDPKAREARRKQEYAEDRAFETWLSTQSASYQAAYRTYQRDEKELDEQNDRVDEKISERWKNCKKKRPKSNGRKKTFTTIIPSASRTASTPSRPRRGPSASTKSSKPRTRLMTARRRNSSRRKTAPIF